MEGINFETRDKERRYSLVSNGRNLECIPFIPLNGSGTFLPIAGVVKAKKTVVQPPYTGSNQN